jgi:hypothetical protein
MKNAWSGRNRIELVYQQADFDLKIYEQADIHTLVVRNCTFDALPDGISKLQNLRILCIENTPIKTLPADINLLGKLQELTIEKTAMSELPAAIRDLQELYKLYVPDNKLTEIPEFISGMYRLNYLDISGNPLVVFPTVILRKAYLNYCKCRKMPIFHANFMNYHKNRQFFKTLANLHRHKKTNSIISYSMYLLFSGEVERCKDISLAHLFEVLGFKDLLIKSTALEVLAQKSLARLEANPLQKGSKVAIIGKVQQDKATLQALLEAQGISLEARISDKATHFLLGDGLTIAQQKKICSSKQPFIFLPQMTRFLEAKESFFLVPTATDDDGKDAAAQAEHLSTLLLSADPANIQLACEIMNNNGVPQSLITALFLVVKNQNFDTPIRMAARKLLERNASPLLIGKVKTTKMLSLSYFSEKNLRFFMTDTDLDWRVMMAYFRQHAKFKFIDEAWFEFMPEADLKTLYLYLVKNPKFVLRADLVKPKIFKQLLKWHQPKKIWLHYLSELPKYIFQATELEALLLQCMNKRNMNELVLCANFPKLKELSLHYCDLRTFPDVLYSLKDITKISLEGNYIPIESINADIFDTTDYEKNKVLTRI